MNKIAELYLNRVLHLAELPEEQSDEVRAELVDHLEELIAERRQRGMDEEEAVLSAVKSMGHPRKVGLRFSRPWQWIDIRARGTARGFIAIGPRAIGVFAFGGVAVGVVAIGGAAIGVVSLAGLGLGLIAWAGFALGLVATGGMAIGVVAAGGMAVGLVAAGGFALGLMTMASGEGVAHFAAGAEPHWLQQLSSLMAIPEFIMVNMRFILPAYLALIGICVGLQARQTRKLEQDELDQWLYD